MVDVSCSFCKLEVFTRNHHLVPKSRGGGVTTPTCETCEGFIHSTWNHNELRDIYNNVETILNDEKFKKFLKWRLKQPVDSLFKSDRGKNRIKHKYK